MSHGKDGRIGMEHGAGGAAMRMLIEEVLAAGLGDAGGPVDGIGLEAMDDGAALRVGDRWLVIATDSHVVEPDLLPGRGHRAPGRERHRQRPGHDGRDRAPRPHQRRDARGGLRRAPTSSG